MMQLDAECSQLHQQINDLKETLVKETRSWETDRTSLSRQLELVGSFNRSCSFQIFTLRLYEAYTHGIAVDVCLSVCLSNACIVTKRKPLAKKVHELSNEPKMNIIRCP